MNSVVWYVSCVLVDLVTNSALWPLPTLWERKLVSEPQQFRGIPPLHGLRVFCLEAQREWRDLQRLCQSHSLRTDSPYFASSPERFGRSQGKQRATWAGLEGVYSFAHHKHVGGKVRHQPGHGKAAPADLHTLELSADATHHHDLGQAGCGTHVVTKNISAIS